jgi:hypothetical protein
VRLSVENLAKRVKDTRILRTPPALVGNVPQFSHHVNCAVEDFRNLVSGVLAGIMSPVLESHRTHMAVQKHLGDERIVLENRGAGKQH